MSLDAPLSDARLIELARQRGGRVDVTAAPASSESPVVAPAPSFSPSGDA